MWIWDKLTKAEVIRTENELKIQTLAEWKVWVVGLGFTAFVMLISSSLNFMEVGLTSFFIVLPILDFLSKKMSRSNSSPLFMQGDELPKLLIPKQVELSNAIFPPPYFIDLIVVSEKQSIKIHIANRGQNVGKFTLKTGDDLTKVIDGIMELLDVELIENIKLSNSEVLSFKSKNSTLPAYSDIQVDTIPNILLLKSKTDSGKWIQFDFKTNTVKNHRKTRSLKFVNRFVIKTKNQELKVVAVLKNHKTTTMFIHKSSEINVIRDKRFLKKTLENRQELRGIEIKLIEKT